MNIKVKNISDNDITLFVRQNDTDARVTISPKQSLIVDDYETKTMKIFKRKGIITTEEIQPFYSDAHCGDNIVIKSKNCNVVVKKEILETLENYYGIPQSETIKDMLEIAEAEVEQYVEDGYIKGVWTDEDIIFLKKYYPTKGRKYCSTHLNRNETSVQKKITSMGIKKKKKK